MAGRDLTSDFDPEADVARFVAGSTRLMSVLAPAFQCFILPLSAGRDSRAVLSLLRDVASSGEIEIQTETSRGTDIVSRIDAQIAAQLSKIAGAAHPGATDRCYARCRRTLAQRSTCRNS